MPQPNYHHHGEIVFNYHPIDRASAKRWLVLFVSMYLANANNIKPVENDIISINFNCFTRAGLLEVDIA